MYKRTFAPFLSLEHSINFLEKLISDVASPGGTTEAALKVLLKKEKPNLISILKKAILEANKKSLELGNFLIFISHL